MGKAIVCGGSIGGLFCSAALAKAGWDVTVVERSTVELSGRGAGIVTHRALIEALETVGAETENLGVVVEERVAYDIDGGRVRALPFPQVVTPWDRMHQGLRALVPDGAYQLGRSVTSYREADGAVEAVFADGRALSADLLVGADGFRSAIRAKMLPEITPRYAGYIVWRALADEAALAPAIAADLFHTFGFFVADDTQIIGYPIAGANNDLEPGARRYNFVWYEAVDETSLADMLTDATGKRHAMSIPPPLIHADVLARMEANAATRLPAPFVDILHAGERPFFTPIYDHHAPTMTAGRVALAGDAACVARPHVGMGVTKAAGDALSLASALPATGSVDVPGALGAYSAERVPAARLAYDRAQHLGRLIFRSAEDATPPANRDGRTHPRLDEIMRTTAVDVTALPT